jgi:hypothetical protein
MILGLLEQRKCPQCERLEPIGRRRIVRIASIEGGQRTGQRLRRSITCGLRALEGLLGDLGSPSRVGAERLGEIELEVDVEPQRARQVESARQQPTAAPSSRQDARRPAAASRSPARSASTGSGSPSSSP